MADKDEDMVDGPPAGSEIHLGFKTTAESVPAFYRFGQWYRRRVHVVPLNEEWIRKNPGVYENNWVLYECEYAGDVERYEPFILPEYVRVLNSTCSIYVDRVGDVVIGKSGVKNVLFKSSEEPKGPEHTCDNCGKRFKESLGWWGSGSSGFCSQECRDEYDPKSNNP